MKQLSATIILLITVLVSLGAVNHTYAKGMTLKEKIGQMLMLGFKGTTLTDQDAIVKAIMAQEVGGVILFDYDFATKSYHHNIESPEQLKMLTHSLQDYAKKAAKKHGNQLSPLLIALDYEGGKVTRLKENQGFPKTMSAAEIAQFSDPEITRYAEMMANTLKQEGINVNFAPVVDVNINPNNPIIGHLGRSFSNDPQKVIHDAAIFSGAFKKAGVLCAYKHFPGHGSATGDTHEGFVDVTSTWQQSELLPYETLLHDDEACPMVMTAHVVHSGLDRNAYPASLSADIVQKILRDKIKFQGVVITDDLQMKAITDHYNLREAVRLAVNAGADIMIFGNQLQSAQDPKQIVDMIYDDVKAGLISVKRIEESYQRIVRLKKRLM